MFRAHVLIIRSKLHYTAFGIITPSYQTMEYFNFFLRNNYSMELFPLHLRITQDCIMYFINLDIRADKSNETPT